MMKPGLVVLACLVVCSCHIKREDRLEPGVGVGNADVREVPKPKIERGEYLSTMLGCKYCHMATGPKGPDFDRPFAGGFEVRETFGTWRSPNITPSKDSGIGAWTDAQIAAAIREGRRPDGTHLYPVMPYLSFNRMTDDDTNALVAYLRTVSAVDNAVAPNDLALPQRPAAAPTNTADAVADPVRHGEYLVTIMNCGMCHTPSGPDGMPDPSKQFAGGVEIEIPMLGTGTLYAGNITSDPTTGIGKWSQAEVEHAVKTPGVGGARVQAYLTGSNRMTDRDLAAIAAYLRTIPPIKNKVPESSFKAMGWMDALAGSRTGELPQITARR
jgi:mono/diheme cytochrome c family protein